MPTGHGIAAFDDHLPAELIAQEPAAGRTLSQLMVVDRASGEIRTATFDELLR